MRGEKINGHRVVGSNSLFTKEYVCGLCAERYYNKDKFTKTTCPYEEGEV